LTTLSAHIVVRRGDFHMDVGLSISDGDTVALLGPNGAGKSTIVHSLAGLVALDDGEIVVGDDVWERPAEGIKLLPQQRSVGVVFQGGLLFPALDVLDNVAFGLRAQGIPRQQAQDRARGVLDRFGAGHLAARAPADLSGGEAQRVAVARALAVEPALLLLDEPMSALDVGNRADARRILRDALRSFTGIKLLVTHEPLEAMALADRLVVIERGAVVQTGSVSDVRNRPRSRYAASLVGLNLLEGRIDRRCEHQVIASHDGELVIASPLPTGTEALATIHPRAVALARTRPFGSARNVLAGTITDLDLEGDRVRVLLDSRPALTAEVTLEALDELDLRPGRQVWASVKATQIDVYPA
jgi:molybdate transport system ATP-binding protein